MSRKETIPQTYQNTDVDGFVFFFAESIIFLIFSENARGAVNKKCHPETTTEELTYVSVSVHRHSRFTIVETRVD